MSNKQYPMIGWLTKLFPVWAILLSTIAYFFPNAFSGSKSAIISLLTVVMFGMGMTLNWSHFIEIAKSPGIIFIGVMLQYLVMPFVSTLAILIIIAIIVGLNQPKLKDIGIMIICSVILHNITGLLCGYWVPRLLRYDDQTCRTLRIKVGMQNSGLSVALAVKYFSIVAAIPGAIFSIWHNLSGSFLAGYWSSKNNR